MPPTIIELQADDIVSTSHTADGKVMLQLGEVWVVISQAQADALGEVLFNIDAE